MIIDSVGGSFGDDEEETRAGNFLMGFGWKTTGCGDFLMHRCKIENWL